MTGVQTCALPIFYKKGGAVSQDAMHMAVMNQKVQRKAAGDLVVKPAIKGLIRNISRKEEPVGSFLDLIKQKQEAGEYRTPFKFERAPAKSKQEIEALAERMAPQMRGEFVRGKNVSDSVAGLSRKEFERQKEMKTDIRRELPEIKPVDISEQKDNVIVGVSGDPSLAQADIFGINDVQLMSPVRSYGGPLYGVNNPAFWASGLGAATGLRSTAARASLAHGDAPVIGQFIKAPEGMGYALHTLDALLAFQRPELLGKSKLQSLNRKIRAGQAGYGEFPHFVGFEDPDLVLLQAQHDPKLRTFLADTLMKPTVSKEYGLFHGQDVKAALTEPELRNVEAGATGFSMGRLFPEQSFTQSSHPTYEVDIPGEFMGRSKYLMPYELSFPDTLKFARENPEKGVSEYLRFKGSGPRQIVDPQYIDEIKMYEEAMKSRLGWKKGGLAHKAEGSSADDFELKRAMAGSVIPLEAELEAAKRAAMVNPLLARQAARRRGQFVPEEPQMPVEEPQATIKPYDPTFRQKTAGLIERGLRNVSPADRARDIAQGTMGVGGLGVADFVPFIGTGMALQEAKRGIEEARREGKPEEAWAELLGGIADAAPGIGPTVKMAKPVSKALANEAAYRI